jgi:hypothetical protein
MTMRLSYQIQSNLCFRLRPLDWAIPWLVTSVPSEHTGRDGSGYDNQGVSSPNLVQDTEYPKLYPGLSQALRPNAGILQ